MPGVFQTNALDSEAGNDAMSLCVLVGFVVQNDPAILLIPEPVFLTDSHITGPRVRSILQCETAAASGTKTRPAPFVRVDPHDRRPRHRAAARHRSKGAWLMGGLLKFFGSVIGIIFLIGLIVVILLLALIF